MASNDEPHVRAEFFPYRADFQPPDMEESVRVDRSLV
jgi:hypothetical protein